VKVAVLEYLSGGGLIGNAISPSLHSEGFAMLSALSNDLVLSGHQVHTCLDRASLTQRDPLHPEVQLHELGPAGLDWLKDWDAIARTCDRTIVIAPELDFQLEQIVERLRATGSIVLASSKDFLRATSDKLTTARLLSKSNVAHPSTYTLSQFVDESTSTTEPMPMTVKRRDGAGCADMKYFPNVSAVKNWLAKHYIEGAEWIIQPWLTGRPASMAILANVRWHVLGAVEQFIELVPSSWDCEAANVSYQGGTGPLLGVTMDQLERLAQKVRYALPPGAHGWIGIDFLVPMDPDSPKEFVVIEVNPRLTTSYLGYREWYGHKLAHALVENEGLVSLAAQLSSTPKLLERAKW
jgi:tyramine---L-glutamate ligase